MKLMNVRLNDEDVARVKELRRRGIEFSTIVRDALRKSHEEHTKASRRPDPAIFFAEMDKEHPLPKDMPPRGYDVHDRRQAREAIRAHLNRKRRVA